MPADESGVIGRNILDLFAITLDGPRRTWSASSCRFGGPLAVVPPDPPVRPLAVSPPRSADPRVDVDVELRGFAALDLDGFGEIFAEAEAARRLELDDVLARGEGDAVGAVGAQVEAGDRGLAVGGEDGEATRGADLR